ncbi:uncharacterized protein BYT42DRAFT_575754 [Radiomyces spectabilis]|uniref:uncharacterized protein n=1 Tax=Radiomyces spectabilis TaxID=64574 RepID=UPI00221F5BB4|nr:uncharacterized protein BYT42DRAFT_575754 [Radiomyces spectabilis]KAI8374268.1 hypothetical protein BYT42DRAFT_575754 [Radiomyces spectabilis]
MVNSKQHSVIPTSVGLSLGFVGIIGLVLSLISLLPLNIYNITISVQTLSDVLKYEMNETQDWRQFSAEGIQYASFLAGAIVSSLITVILVFATCCCHRPRPSWETGELDSFHGDMAISELENSCESGHRRNGSLWLSRLGCLIFVLQIGWASFGTHVLFNTDSHRFPTTIYPSTMVVVCILWLNYIILILFAFILFCASIFILLGTTSNKSKENTAKPSLGRNATHSPADHHDDTDDETAPLLG